MSTELVETWSADDQAMEERHQRHWQYFVDLIEEPLENLSVLDFGCNQGGFLRKLHGQNPFAFGLGVDVAEQSVAVAKSRQGDLPLRYEATTTPEELGDDFDLAVSNAVVYLIADLAHHASVIKKMLKPGAVYYATHSEYGERTDIEAMRAKIDAYSPMKMQTHTLTDIARAFDHEGFAVTVQRFRPGGFVALDMDEFADSEVSERLRNDSAHKYIFRMTAPG